jgi:hypothetical protein
VLVVLGADDQRWRSSSAAAYRVVPGARVELLPGVGLNMVTRGQDGLVADVAAGTGKVDSDAGRWQGLPSTALPP